MAESPLQAINESLNVLSCEPPPGRSDIEANTYPSKSKRPNYSVIHARPLPIVVHPLPPLILHNPLSIFYLAFAYLKEIFATPDSHVLRCCGYFSTETRSVHVTEDESIRRLWENGFLGKGALSRSEPSWLQRERRRLGVFAEETAEEITARRREERRAFKAERARKEKEERDRQHGIGGIPAIREEVMKTADHTAQRQDSHPVRESNKAAGPQISSLVAKANDSPLTSRAISSSSLVNHEHLQLDLVEAFFLTYALGMLDIYDPATKQNLSSKDLFRLCLTHSRFPPTQLPHTSLYEQPDNPFLVAYAAYHHFRSLGWVVRSGVKFAVDLLLYPRGPVFAHAEFAVILIPSYAHPYWRSDDARGAYNPPRPKPWHSLHMVNRVQAQVRKTLVLCYVNVPPPFTEPELNDSLDMKKLLEQYTVREMVLKRWVPNRNRD